MPHNEPFHREYLLQNDTLHAHFQYDLDNELSIGLTFLGYNIHMSCTIRWKHSEEKSPNLATPPNIVQRQAGQGILCAIDIPNSAFEISQIRMNTNMFVAGSAGFNEEFIQEYSHALSLYADTSFYLETIQGLHMIALERSVLHENIYSKCSIIPESNNSESNGTFVYPRGSNHDLSFMCISPDSNSIRATIRWELLGELPKEQYHSLVTRELPHWTDRASSVVEFLHTKDHLYSGSPLNTHIEVAHVMLFLVLSHSALSKTETEKAVDTVLNTLPLNNKAPSKILNSYEATLWRIVHGSFSDKKYISPGNTFLLTDAFEQIFLLPICLLFLLKERSSFKNYFEEDPSGKLQKITKLLSIINTALEMIPKKNIHRLPQLFPEKNVFSNRLSIQGHVMQNIHLIPILLYQLERWYARDAIPSYVSKLIHVCEVNKFSQMYSFLQKGDTYVLAASKNSSMHLYTAKISYKQVKPHLDMFFASASFNTLELSYLRSRTLTSTLTAKVLSLHIERGKRMKFKAKQVDGSVLPIMTANFCFDLFFSHPKKSEMEMYCDLMTLPYPIGLHTPIGIISENVCYVNDSAIISQATKEDGTARVFYVWQQCMIVHGLYRYVQKSKCLPKELFKHINKIYTWLLSMLHSLPVSCNTYTFACKKNVIQVATLYNQKKDSVSLLYGSLLGLHWLPPTLEKIPGRLV